MLISSNFHDYYDGILSFGIDKTVVYNRKEALVEWNDSANQVPGYSTRHRRLPNSEDLNLKRNGSFIHYKIYKFYVGFCNNVYPVVEIQKYENNQSETYHFYNAEDCLSFLTSEKIKVDKNSRRFFLGSDYSIKSREEVVKFFESGSEYSKAFETIHQEYNTPVFLVGRGLGGIQNPKGNLIVNPCLKSIKFAKVEDPVNAFQKIYMFISGVLGTPEKPMIEISDKDKAAAKGHDGEYSFKRPPNSKVWR